MIIYFVFRQAFFAAITTFHEQDLFDHVVKDLLKNLSHVLGSTPGDR
jgi:hypothetical protein